MEQLDCVEVVANDDVENIWRRCTGRIQLIVTTRSLLAYRATPETDPVLPHCDTRRVHFDRRVSPEARDLASLFFRRCWWPNLDKYSAVLGLVQDEPALRAGAASGILDKTCARRLCRRQVGSEEWSA